MWTSANFGGKYSGFSKIYGVSARTKVEGVEPVRTFYRQEESIFSQFCAESFMDGP